MEELKPCPFCGGTVTIGESYEGEDDLQEIWIMSCDKCPSEMRGVRVDIPLMAVKGDTCIDSATGLREEYTDTQIQFLNKARLDKYSKDEKNLIIEYWNKRA